MVKGIASRLLERDVGVQRHRERSNVTGSGERSGDKSNYDQAEIKGSGLFLWKAEA